MSKGRPPFSATQEQRGLVTGLTLGGATAQTAARILDLDIKTLRKHFAAELNLSTPEACGAIARAVAHTAGDPKAGRRKSMARKLLRSYVAPVKTAASR